MKCARCTVNADEFQQALDKVLKAAAKKARISFLEEALVRFDGSTCTLTCTDLELWCQAVIPAQGEPCAFVLADSRKLLTACKYFSGDLQISYSEDDPPKTFPTKTALDGSLVLTCGNKELRQWVTTAEDFPDVPEVRVEYSYTVDPCALSKRFERIKYALSLNKGRPTSCCVKFFDNRIGAVDGYRLAVNKDEALQVEKPFHIPPVAMKLLPIFGEAECWLSVGEKHAAFETDAVRVIIRMPEGESLDFDRAIPKTFCEEHTIDIADFMDNLRYLGEFMRDPDRDIIRFDNGTLSMSNVNGDYSARLTLDEVPRTVIGFRGYYMLDGLKQFHAKKLSAVAMRMTSPTSPIVLTDGEDLAMVLPHRLRSTENAA